MPNNIMFSLPELPMPMVYAAYRTIRDCNNEFSELFGYERPELLNTGFHLLYPKFADFIRTGQMWQANLASDNVYYDERVMLRRDQTRFWCQVHGRSKSPSDPFAEAVYCFAPINQPLSSANSKLTQRQLQIITLVAQGKTSRVIAHEIGISVRTVEAHRSRIMHRLNIKNAAELVKWFQGN